ncbi:MAG: ankyrin repeat domain-containing protein [Planctomycetota bacterium]|nr:ankyrin repeat domain-containing protein [Planctomycetota bacterium]
MRSLRRTVPAALCAAAIIVLCGCSQSDDGGEPASQPESNNTLAPAGAEAPVVRLASWSRPAPAPADDEQDEQKKQQQEDEGGQAQTGQQKSRSSSLSGSSALQRNRPTPPVEESGEAMIVCEPEVLDLGEIPTNEAGNGKVTLVNIGDEPRKIIQCKKSCGCTTLDCPEGKVLQPGESVDINIRLTAGTRARNLSKSVRFMVEKQPPILLKVVAEALSLVKVEPYILDREKHPDGRIVLTSTDGEPFTVRTVFPAAFGDELPSEPKTEHELFLDWEKWEELKQQRRLLFTLDHPRCRRVYARIDRGSIKLPPPPPPGNETRRRSGPSFKAMLQRGDAEGIAKGIEEGKIKVDALDRRNRTPLARAAKAGEVEIMQVLLDASADLGAIDNMGRKPLSYAAQSKNVEALKLLLDAGADLGARDNLGNTALSWAAGFGDAATVKALIEAGADIEVVTSVTGFTPIVWASLTGEAESIRELIKAGAEIEAADAIQGATPLMHAVRTGGPESVKVLIEAGADLEARDYQRNTPLLLAAESAAGTLEERIETIRLLLDAGADVTATDRAGRNALDAAMNRTDAHAVEVAELLKGVIVEGVIIQGGGKAKEKASGK